jgi:hypothetical protein
MAKQGTCKAENCDRTVRAKGYCDRHYRKWRKGLMGKPRYRTCTEEGCLKRRVRKSLCEEHWLKKHGKSAPPAEQPAV